MSLVMTGTFDEYYDQLTHREWTLLERLNAVKRDEVGARERIAEDEQLAFADVLHIAGVMIGEKKKRESGRGARGSGQLVAATTTRGQHEQQRVSVWLPATQPRSVPRPAGRPRLAFPHAAYTALCNEETELRGWLHGVERRLREQVEQACARSWFVLTCLQQLVEHEQRARARVLRDEYERFAQLRRSVFLLAPADYFRKEAMRRHGHRGGSHHAAAAAAIMARDEAGEEHGIAGVVAREAAARAAVEASERAAHAQLCAYVDEMYQTRLFMVNHQEIVGRLVIEDAARDALYPLIERACRASFGLPYHRTAAVVLHSGGAYRAVLMQQLCMRHHDDLREHAHAFMQSYAQQQQQQQEGGQAALPWECKLLDTLSVDEKSRLLMRYCDDERNRHRGSQSSARTSTSSAPTPAAALRLLPVKTAAAAMQQQQQQQQSSCNGGQHTNTAMPTTLSGASRDKCSNNSKPGVPTGATSHTSASPSDTGLTPTLMTSRYYAHGNGHGHAATDGVAAAAAARTNAAAATPPAASPVLSSLSEMTPREESLTTAAAYTQSPPTLPHGNTDRHRPASAMSNGRPASDAGSASNRKRSSSRVTITTQPTTSRAKASPSPRDKRSSFHAFMSDEDE